jgi:hypothetical protein
MSSIAERLAAVRSRIEAAARRAARPPEAVTLITVTKTHPVEIIREVLAAGSHHLGENRLQEAETKITRIPATDPARPVWHLIGHLQTNKAKVAVRLFDWIHSVDSLRIAEALDKECEKQGRDALNVLVQVNISGEDTKSGVEPGEAAALLRQLAELPRLRVRGLMTMAPYEAVPEETRPVFRGLRQLRDELARTAPPGVSLDELSMGMTNDFEVAIEEGATLLRIGRAIFED